jgi:hypothetical protein
MMVVFKKSKGNIKKSKPFQFFLRITKAIEKRKNNNSRGVVVF